ncbi:MAG: TonB-dependent receptor [Saprospirales bacterium]|nr:TonB-dependent receptor [Saprospirales bacterium]
MMKNIAVLWVLLYTTVVVIGQTTDTLAVVVVTAQRMEEPLTDIPLNISTITAVQSQTRQDRSTPEMLLSVPGVFVQKTNHGGGSPFLRGLTGNQTLLLVDGIRLSNATFRYGPNQYLNTIDPFSIERMEIWKGGGSVPYGSDALGGTIQVRTIDPSFSSGDPVFSGQALGLWRSQGMEKTAHPEGEFSARRVAIHLGGTIRDFGDLVGGDTTGLQSPSGYPEGAFDIKAKVMAGERNILTGAYQFFRQTNVPVYHKIQLEDYARNHFSLQQRQLGYFRWERFPEKSFFEKITATASFQQTDEHRESQKNNNPVLRREADAVSSAGFSVQAEAHPLQAWRMVGGIEFYNDQVGSQRVDIDNLTSLSTDKRGLYPDGSVFSSLAAFWINHWDWEKWGLTAGARYNQFFISVNEETLGKTQLNPGATVYQAALLRKISDTGRLFAGIQTGFRAPNIDDLGSLGIVDFRYEVPTLDLKPERSTQAETGYRLVTPKLQTEVSAFWNELRNLITRVRVEDDSIGGYPVYRKENAEEGFIFGAEARADWTLGQRLRLRGAVTLAIWAKSHQRRAFATHSPCFWPPWFGI